jgi:16S rRNA (cytosine967-C5)-methyltransferase
MITPFRKKHLTILLKNSITSKISLDLLAHMYFKANRSLGSKDRPPIKKALYEILKWRLLLNYFGANSAESLIDLYLSENSPIGRANLDVPAHIRVSFPKWLFDKLTDSLGEKEALKFCLASNLEAPVTIRVNKAKCESEEFYHTFKEPLLLTKCTLAKHGFHVGKKIQFSSLSQFEEGHFEIQDEASQVIGESVNAKKNQHILDYCAGSGGKTLAFAPEMEGSGQVHLHDIRKKPLVDAKKRLNRAGIQNFQIYFGEEKRLKSLEGNMDTVLVDAPCSCSGTFRRRPDQKYSLTEEFLREIILTQREILLKAIPFVKKGGTLIYATCSALTEENEDQVEFLKKREELTFISQKAIPLKEMGQDAMFLAIFKKNSLV